MASAVAAPKHLKSRSLEASNLRPLAIISRARELASIRVVTMFSSVLPIASMACSAPRPRWSPAVQAEEVEPFSGLAARITAILARLPAAHGDAYQQEREQPAPTSHLWALVAALLIEQLVDHQR